MGTGTGRNVARAGDRSTWRDSEGAKASGKVRNHDKGPIGTRSGHTGVTGHKGLRGMNGARTGVSEPIGLHDFVWPLLSDLTEHHGQALFF